MEANEASGLLSREAIAQRAYGLFQQRGYEHGHDLEDWLQAEAELAQGSSTSEQGQALQAERAQSRE